ncbi:MAG: protein phosphatase 2C domain-containing protein [Deltaproteobacteria bacterium]|nr:protein phosphatase 2C domain-containing protein [Deltaproteobacteria bacterium]
MRHRDRGGDALFAVLVGQAAGSRKAHGPCDDAVATADVRAGRRRVWLCAVADGAGSATRGGEGARLAVAAAVHAMRGRIADGFDGGVLLQTVRAELGAAATQKTGGIRELATTVTLVAADAQATWVASVGDGAVVYRTAADQAWQVAAWPMRGEYANSTQFVTDDELVFTQAKFPAAQAIAVMTDGLTPLALDFALRRPFAPFFDGVALEMGRRNVAELAPHLQDLLRSPRVTERTDDDVTLVFALRAARAVSR